MTVILFVRDLLLRSRINASGAFTLQNPDWDDPVAGINPEESVAVVDCNLKTPDAIELIRTLRRAHPKLTIVGFVSHVDGTTQAAAKEAGITAVYPRSQFFGRTEEILRSAHDSL